jgi:PTS system galactitol-specific IIA component
MLNAELCLVRLSALSAAEVLHALAARLLAKGHVAASFERAALSREKKSPTGLPFAPWPVALPHADPEHALSPAIAIATLARPVVFRQMGSPGVALDVFIVVMPVLTAKEQAAASLSRLVTVLQSEDTRRRMIDAERTEDLLKVVSETWDVQ